MRTKLLGYLGFALGMAAASLSFAGQAQAAPPPGFQTSLIVGTGLSDPTGFDIAPDGRIFILQRTGEVLIYKNGALLPQPFAVFSAATNGDRGLIGIAFDPDFTTNHWVYFYYAGTDNFLHLVRFDASGDVGTNGPLELYDTTVPSQQFHVGGTVQFGPDGKLYLSIGDNGNPPNSQDLSNPFGKILRLNKDGSIPNDNPFVGQAGKLPEIWAYGLRNPFRFQFDSASGRLYEGDVGQSTWEEVNIITKGADYGWPTCEGFCVPANPQMTDPIYEYNHTNGASRAIAGGPVYQGSMFPASYVGQYFFGDYAGGFIQTLSLDANGKETAVNNFEPSAGSVVDLKVAPDGSLYYLTIFPGQLFRVSYSTGNQIPAAFAGADTAKGPAPLTVHFSSAGSFDPENTPLTYLWDFGDSSTSTAANPTKVYNNPGTYTVQLKVSDGVNTALAQPLVIQVGTPPTLSIDSPTDGSNYEAGDIISYSGHATDKDGNVLPASAFSLQVFLHHHTHIHPFLGPITSQSGQFTIPTIGEPSADTWYEIQMTATDSVGLATTQSVFIYPIKSNLTFSTSPPNLNIILDGQPFATPQTIQGVVGFQRQLSAPGIQALNNNNYVLDHWSDGGAATHFITTAASDTSYTAFFVQAPSFTGQYFANQTLSGTPTLTRQDPTINFSWGSGSPDPSIPVDHFSARWTSDQPFGAGTYAFTATADDGVRVYVDNNLIIDEWIDQPPTTYTASVALTAGSHNIKMEYYENAGGATAELSWVQTSSQQPPPPPSPSPLPPPPPPPSPVQMVVAGDPSSGPYSVEAQTTLSPIDHVDFVVDGNLFHTEHYFPYSLFGDDNVTPYKNNISPGTHTILANIYSTSGLLGSGSVTVTEGSAPPPPPSPSPLPPPPPPPSPVQMVVAGDPSSGPYSVEAQTTLSPIDHVDFVVDGNLFHTEHYFPYSLFGDDNVTPYKNNISPGTHTIVANVYSTTGLLGSGTVTVTEGSVSPPPPPPPPPPPSPSPTPPPAGFNGQYFSNMTLSGSPVLTRVDPAINFNWDTTSPDPSMPRTQFSVRWTATQNFTAGSHSFLTKSDDGIRVFVDGSLIINDWTDHPLTTDTATVPLTAGSHQVIVEYYQNGGGADAIFQQN